MIQPVLLFLMVAASRGVAHYLLGGNYKLALGRDAAANVLIYGAGASGRQLAAALARSAEMRVVGFLDDDRLLHGALLHGKPIYDPNDIVDLARSMQVADVLLAIPSASRSRRRAILEILRPAAVNVRTLPGLLELASGRIQVNELRPLEIEDLLGRDAVAPSETLLRRNIAGKTVLVTGGGGSIGSELCRQILDLNPARLLLVETSEFALYSIHGDLENRQRIAGRGDIQIIPFLASVKDEARMKAIMERWRPATVYHAAAYKHVPLVEHNAIEGIKNNVFGTLAAARAAIGAGVADFVLISTDKAVRPTNVMGASKRLAEMVLQALAASATSTRFAMVRFGNVLGSSGSVVPLFRQQIANGGPVTITHDEVTRYFMTIPEAAQLVIQAGAMASGGEVFVLDMGDPVRVRDLAVNMIELSGLSVRDAQHPDGDIAIDVIGLRPGEKLYEELLIGEDPMATDHVRIMQAREPFLPMSVLGAELDAMERSIADHSVEAVTASLRRLVPEYQSECKIHDFLVAAPREDLKEIADGRAQADTSAPLTPRLA